MSNKFMSYFCLFMALLSAFIYGTYVTSTFAMNKTIEPHRWVITGLFGLIWVGLFFKYYDSHER